MEVSIIGIALMASKVAAFYGVSIAATQGMQYFHDFKLTNKKKTRRGGGRSDSGDFENTITRLRSDLSQSE